MGFRQGSYCTVWSTEVVSDTLTKGRISVSRKNKNTGEYETDFNGFVSFVGTTAAGKAASLKERDRIRLGDVDVTNKYDKEKNVTYTNCKIFSFDKQDDSFGNTGTAQSTASKTSKAVDDGEIDDADLPF